MTYHNAHAARIHDDIVQDVIVIPYMDDDDAKITEYCNDRGKEGTWLDCSFLGARRGRYPGIGYRYIQEIDQFIPPHWVNVDGIWQDPNPPTVEVIEEQAPVIEEAP
jgi:hypothetical protein